MALLLWGMARVRTKRVAKGGNPLALRGLELALGAWVLLLLQAAFAPMLARWPGLAVLAATALLGVTAGVLAAAGFWRSWELRSGGGAAICGALIGFGVAGILTWGFLSGFNRSREEAAVQAAPERLREFSLRWVPPPGWVRLEPGQMNPRAQLNYIRIEPSMAFMIMGERLPEGQEIEESAVLTYLHRSMMVDEGSRDLAPLPTRVGGREGRQLVVSNAGPDHVHDYVAWYWHDRRTLLLLLVAAKNDQAHSDRLLQEARRVLDGVGFDPEGQGG